MGKALATGLLEDLSVTLPGKWEPTYWRPPGRLDYEKYELILDSLRNARNTTEESLSTLLWWLSDVMRNGEAYLGEDFFQMVDSTGYTKESLIKIRRVGEEFQSTERFNPHRVSFWTHWDVQRVNDPAKRRELLEKYATDPDYSREDLRDEVKLFLDALAGAQTSIDDELGGEDGKEGDGGLDGNDELPPCPLCSGAGKVTRDRRDAYLMEESPVMR